ncbi:hypothetical protein F5Y19DRAFT_481058 [Xylariaceae sp. FL1651]|nr:hypothetical protein F5Y19DRAFT_481058 [Xylariaceae sp. FL1651]
MQVTIVVSGAFLYFDLQLPEAHLSLLASPLAMTERKHKPKSLEEGKDDSPLPSGTPHSGCVPRESPGSGVEETNRQLEDLVLNEDQAEGVSQGRLSERDPPGLDSTAQSCNEMDGGPRQQQGGDSDEDAPHELEDDEFEISDRQLREHETQQSDKRLIGSLTAATKHVRSAVSKDTSAAQPPLRTTNRHLLPGQPSYSPACENLVSEAAQGLVNLVAPGLSTQQSPSSTARDTNWLKTLGQKVNSYAASLKPRRSPLENIKLRLQSSMAKFGPRRSSSPTVQHTQRAESSSQNPANPHAARRPSGLRNEIIDDEPEPKPKPKPKPPPKRIFIKWINRKDKPQRPPSPRTELITRADVVRAPSTPRNEAPRHPNAVRRPAGPREGISNHATRTLRDGTIVRGSQGVSFAGFIPGSRIQRPTRATAPSPSPEPSPRHVSAAAASTTGLRAQAPDVSPDNSRQVAGSNKRAVSEGSSDICLSPTKKSKIDK